MMQNKYEEEQQQVQEFEDLVINSWRTQIKTIEVLFPMGNFQDYVFIT